AIDITTLTNGGQSAMYEAKQMVTAYENNIALHFGNYLRAVANKLLRVKERKAQLRAQLAAQNRHRTDINSTIRTMITQPTVNVKH
ncbi:hypothetical protein LPJ53_006420, partial [Coemansia erecta]